MNEVPLAPEPVLDFAHHRNYGMRYADGSAYVYAEWFFKIKKNRPLTVDDATRIIARFTASVLREVKGVR